MTLDESVPDDDLLEVVDGSYDDVVSGLPPSKRSWGHPTDAPLPDSAAHER